MAENQSDCELVRAWIERRRAQIALHDLEQWDPAHLTDDVKRQIKHALLHLDDMTEQFNRVKQLRPEQLGSLLDYIEQCHVGSKGRIE